MSFKPKNIEYAEKYKSPGLKVNEESTLKTNLDFLLDDTELLEIYINEAGVLDDGREFQKLTVITKP